MRIRVTGISGKFRIQWDSSTPGAARSHNLWARNKFIRKLVGVKPLVTGNQRLMEFFARADTGNFAFSSRANRFCEVHDLDAGNFRDENFSSLHQIKAFHHKLYALL